MTAQRRRGSMADAAARQPHTGPQTTRGPVASVRVRPFKATFDLDGALLRAVRVWAAGHDLVGVAPVVRALILELADDVLLSAAVEDAITDTGPQTTRGPVVKTTYDLDPPIYRTLKSWAASHDTTGAAVLRALLGALVDDRDGHFSHRIAAAARQT